MQPETISPTFDLYTMDPLCYKGKKSILNSDLFVCMVSFLIVCVL